MSNCNPSGKRIHLFVSRQKQKPIKHWQHQHAFVSFKTSYLFPYNISIILRNSQFNSSLFSDKTKSSITKIQCIISYLERIAHIVPEGILTITRFHYTGPHFDWQNNAKPLVKDITFVPNKGLQNAPHGSTVVDFANAVVGGSFIGSGALQEESLFACFPELITARLLCEELTHKEVVFVHGAEKFNDVTGCGHNLSYHAKIKDHFGRYTQTNEPIIYTN